MKRKVIAVAAGAAFMFVGAGCSKFTEQFKDAGTGARNTGPAEIGTMPDGFSNWATKCDNGNRVYVVFHNDKAFGSIAVVANDPSCASSK